MPPKKSKGAAKPKQPLDKCAITFSTSSSIPTGQGQCSNYTAKDLGALVEKYGGKYVETVDECTHLICSEKQFKANSAKIKQAKAQDKLVVDFGWLDEILNDPKNNSPLKDVYVHYSPSSPAVPRAHNGVKVEDDDNDDNDDKNSAKAPSARKKRRRAEDNDGSDSKADAVAEVEDKPSKAMNVTKKKDLKIPVDEGAPPGYKVFVSDDSVIYDVTLNQSDAKNNANKFYRLQILSSGQYWICWTRWGRVGEFGQCASLGDGDFESCMSQFEKKFKDKTGLSWSSRADPSKKGKYTFIERSYEDSDDEDDNLPGSEKRRKVKQEQPEKDEIVESKLPVAVQNLMQLIFNKDNFNAALADLNYDAQKMPLGKLSKSTLTRGYEVLKQLSSLVTSSSNSSAIADLSNQYLSIIPHVVPRSSRPPVMNTMDQIKNEIALLEALTDMQISNDLMRAAGKTQDAINELDRQFAGLNLTEMSPLDPSTTEFSELENYLKVTIGQTHTNIRYNVEDIFRIERAGEHDRFNSSSFSQVKNKNKRLLWHGSRATNFGGILSQGLRIAPPEAPVNGYMFGKGVYLADMSSKSANYCCAYSSNNTALLLLCEAELGEPPLKLTSADYNAGERAKEAKHLSTWGVGRVAPPKWKDAGVLGEAFKGTMMPDVDVSDASRLPGDTKEDGAYLQYNEFIVYDVAQIRLRYLFRVKM